MSKYVEHMYLVEDRNEWCGFVYRVNDSADSIENGVNTNI